MVVSRQNVESVRREADENRGVLFESIRDREREFVPTFTTRVAELLPDVTNSEALQQRLLKSLLPRQGKGLNATRTSIDDRIRESSPKNDFNIASESQCRISFFHRYTGTSRAVETKELRENSETPQILLCTCILQSSKHQRSCTSISQTTSCEVYVPILG
jgi:hypothetical protein